MELCIGRGSCNERGPCTGRESCIVGKESNILVVEPHVVQDDEKLRTGKAHKT